MLKRMIFTALVATLLTLTAPSAADAWGVRHYGYTHVGPAGAYHVGGTAAYGGFGGYRGYSTAHVGGYGAYGGAYHAGYGAAYGGGYHYSTAHYGNYYGGATRSAYYYR